ncbi:MAG: hypothetical protein DCC58_11090 [Chloroflexi bacterium]|nr:MAG: hypothetical protein DCC58_11090 [Chloroflexota bacterium]
MTNSVVPTSAEHGTGHLQVLLIEEAGWLRSALELALALRGDSVTSTDDPAVAQERAQAGGLDLVIVGMFPTGTHDTVHICRSVRAATPGQLSSVVPPIVICAPTDQPERIVAAVDAGASSFLHVPFDIRQVRARLTQAEQIKLALSAAVQDTAEGRAPEDQIVAEQPVTSDLERMRSGALVERALDPLLIVTPEGLIDYASPAAEQLFGIPADSLAGVSLYTLTHPDDTARALELVGRALEQPDEPLAVDFRIVHHDGTVYDVDARAGNLLEAPGVGGIVLALRDITARKRMEAQLERQALYDSLTRLPNRTLFMDYLEHALARASRRLESVVVMFFDLDNFKLVNDSFGHAFGDALLTRVGERLRGCLRASDTASRWGGDEFTVLLEDVATEQDAIVVAERVGRELNAPFFIDDREIYISVSIGIAFSTPGESRPGDLLRDADVALYRAKAEGKSRYVIFDSGQGGQLRRTTAGEGPATPPAANHPQLPPTTLPPSDTAATALEQAIPTPDDTDAAVRLLLSRIDALEREAGRLQAERADDRRRE